MKRDQRVGLAARQRQKGRSAEPVHCLEINSFLPGSSTSLCVEITLTYQLHGAESLFFVGI